MQSRMDKYNTNENNVNSRTAKNKDLYDDVKASSMDGYSIKSNVAVLDDATSKINVENVKKMLDIRYNENAPKRKSIAIPKEKIEPIVEDVNDNTKEYDINAVLEKAKQGKNVDYNQERLKHVRETQYEILNNLDLELKQVEENENKSIHTQEEKNLMDLINTITELETEYKTSKLKNETEEALDLLSDLKDDVEENVLDKTEKVIETENDKIIEELTKPTPKVENKYDDFKDISSTEASSIIIKIVLIIIIITLVFGAIYLLDNILSLGLFQ